MMKEYVEILKTIFDPVAIFLKDEEFVVVVKDEKTVQDAVKKLSETIDDDISLMILNNDEYEKMKDKVLGERLL
ncbi:hypothetical protein [Fervidobacterium gondwanense]|uniref:Uncharacterized protein n=2 Tax=Fervidobacterium gondwanense TaxID=44754 RepID=A0A1M7T6U0_FERGO|nr:hypothetical protein IB67_09975 [Fervidobacterium riparium]SHN66428.1 hypothetical protein SAMN02745226_01618 [Fervidobacterium gondwanense DSM 13020]